MLLNTDDELIIVYVLVLFTLNYILI